MRPPKFTNIPKFPHHEYQIKIYKSLKILIPQYPNFKNVHGWTIQGGWSARERFYKIPILLNCKHIRNPKIVFKYRSWYLKTKKKYFKDKKNDLQQQKKMRHTMGVLDFQAKALLFHNMQLPMANLGSDTNFAMLLLVVLCFLKNLHGLNLLFLWILLNFGHCLCVMTFWKVLSFDT